MQIQIIDLADKITNFTDDEINNLLLKKEKNWIAQLLTMHKGLNSSHDWNRKIRIGGEKFDD